MKLLSICKKKNGIVLKEYTLNKTKNKKNNE